MNKEDRLAAIQANMDAKQSAINLIDDKIKLCEKQIEDVDKLLAVDSCCILPLSCIEHKREALQNQLAGYLSSRAYMQIEWQKMRDEVEALSETNREVDRCSGLNT